MKAKLGWRLGVMILAVLPVLTFAVALTFWLYPGETASFTELWVNALILVLVGPSILAVGLVLAHAALTPSVRDRLGIGSRTASTLVGGGLGILLGGLWSFVVFWGIGVALLGLFAGSLYGVLSPPDR